MLLLSSLVHASGLMHPPVHQLVQPDCAVLDPARPWPVDRAVYFSGYRSGSTSPPGGPATGHLWPVLEVNVRLRRSDCDVSLGSWTRTEKSCGPAPLLSWQGELEAGASYVLDIDGHSALSFEVEGDSERLSVCPTEP
jgi:hypothetical protein